MKSRHFAEEWLRFLDAMTLQRPWDHSNNRWYIFHIDHIDRPSWCTPPKCWSWFFKNDRMWRGIFWNKCKCFNFWLWLSICCNRKLEIKLDFSKNWMPIWFDYLELYLLKQCNKLWNISYLDISCHTYFFQWFQTLFPARAGHLTSGKLESCPSFDWNWCIFWERHIISCQQEGS